MKKKKLKLNIIVLTILTLGILFFVLKDDFYGITDILLDSNKILIILIILVLLISELFKALSLWTIIKGVKKQYTIKKAFSFVLKTEFFNGITPFALGGQPFQLYSLKNNENIDYATGVNIIYKDYYAYQFAFLTLATIFILINYIFKIVELNSILSKALLLGYLIVLGITAFLFYILHSKYEKSKLIEVIVLFLNKIKIIKDKEKILTKINDNIKRIKNQLRNNKNFAKCYVLNILKLLTLGLAGYICVKATFITGVNILQMSIIVIFAMTVSGFIPIPGGSVGIEYTFITLLSNFVVGPSLNATTILWRFTGFHLLVICGALIFLIEERHRLKRRYDNENDNS